MGERTALDPALGDTIKMALRKTAIKRVIMADAAAMYDYLNDHGETCAIGGLAREAGVEDAVLRVAGSLSIAITLDTDRRGLQAVRVIRRAISRRFGLTIPQQRQIQQANDESNNQDDRRSYILAIVDAMEDSGG